MSADDWHAYHYYGRSRAEEREEREAEEAAELDAVLLARFGPVPDDDAPAPSDADRGVDCEAPQVSDEVAMRLRWASEQDAERRRAAAWKGAA